MASPVLFETPENVQIAYKTAGLGTRFCAWVVDSIFVVIVAILLLLVGSILSGATSVTLDSLRQKLGVRRPVSQDEIRLYLFSVVLLVFQLGSFVYFVMAELLVRGQTIGKRACGVRVVKADGFALDAGSVLVRNVFRLIDQIPLLWIVPLLSGRSQRFGDMVAGTLVVAETQDQIGDLRARLVARDSSESRFRFDAAMLNRTTPTDVEALERILERWSSLNDPQRNILLDRVVEPLAKRLAAPSPDKADRQEFLVELLAAIYRRESREARLMEHNLREFLNVVWDTLHDHWTKFATAALIAAISWYLGRRRARADWGRREFYDRLNISLNAFRDGTLTIRTIAEESCLEVFLNSIAVAALIDAARHTKPEDPLVELPEKDYWYYLNSVLNKVAEKFGEGQIRRDMGIPVTTARYVMCLTSESAGEVRTRKIRAMLIQKDLLLNLPKDDPKFENPTHATRWKTLQYLAAQFQKTPYKFCEVEICV